MQTDAHARSNPSGTVTFAFTDIEGSTQRWERNRAAMDEALKRHDAILRGAIEAHGGSVFKTVGDAFCAAFAHAADAALALIAAQRMLAAEDFSAVDGLRIRAAMHTGTAEERGGDYFGPPVNRVARLLGIAYGGQVLVSGAARELASAALPADATFRDLGRHRLKDLIEPEHVFQLVAPDLVAEFPALRSLEALHHNLPQQMNALIGREDEVAEITALLGAHRLVTVVGAGGIGKTRTTLQAGANLLDGVGDGVWFVELAPVTRSEFIPATIAQAMSVHLGADADPLDALVRALKSKRALLIFDNCEHLIDGASRTIGTLLRGCPELSVLASSRQPLGLAGEATFRMPSLATPAAIALFAERAIAADRRFALDATNAATIAAICSRLDGIPLAIELAAARVKILSPKQLFDRLDERFRVLTGGSRDAMPRQQTLQALIDWSHDLLDERERGVFRRLGIFVNGFTLEGAVAVGAGEDLDELDVLDLLQSLVDKSLVATEPHGDAVRYRLLESTRAYAREKLRSTADDAAAARAHCAYLCGRAAEAYRAFDASLPGWLHPYTVEIDDLRAALEYGLTGGGDPLVGAKLAADAGPIFLRMDLLGEGLHWCEAARAVTGLPDATSGRIEYVASMMHNNLGESRSGLACAERAVAFYEASGDERGFVRALSQVAQLYARSGRVEEARTPADAALRRARALGDSRVLSSVLRRCAASLPASANDQARTYFEEALSIARLGNDAEEASLVLDWWAIREAGSGSLERSIELSVEALACASPDGHVNLELHIAGWYLALHRFSEATPHARRALTLARRVDNAVLRALAILYCAPLHVERDPATSAMLFGYAITRLRELEWEAASDDELTLDNARRAIETATDPDTFRSLVERGASWNEADAFAALTESVSSAPEPRASA